MKGWLDRIHRQHIRRQGLNPFGRPRLEGRHRRRSLGFLIGFLLACATLLSWHPATSAPASAIASNIAATDANLIHLLGRTSFGLAPGDLERVKAMGISAYLQEQLHPEAIALPPALSERLAAASIPTVNAVRPGSDAETSDMPTRSTAKSLRPPGSTLDRARRVRLLHSIASPRQLEAVLVDFWFNHFNVFCCGTGGQFREKYWLMSYEGDAIRPHVLGRFRDMLGATAHHPAMLFYLDNWQNTAPNSFGASNRFSGINENYARELMELHTLGIEGGYQQEDVETLAQILTGWGVVGTPNSLRRRGSVAQQAVSNFLGQQQSERQHSTSAVAADDRWAAFGFEFDYSRHDSSDKVFLGTAIAGGGMEEGELALDLLARHPATARHISYKLAQYFVADDPPTRLVDALSQHFLATDGDLRAVVETLLDSPEFWAAEYRGRKFKPPYQFVISSLRAVGANSGNPFPRTNNGAGVNQALNRMNMPLYGCRIPTGYSNLESDWLSSDALLARTHFAANLSRPQSRYGYDPASAIARTVLPQLAADTAATIASNPPELQPTLMLGSPEMMYR
ncbi:DUF1800 domain-containing protein [Synechococcus sp. PCC 7336]|uniref:DUF1800 domain-containing protein n=1 Tax=Synechococcus sp. PCC 7336 TaxID=195250 RepID=UPI00034D2DA6|nr:DUF1800 domain-containing protein [Synechococcus sp. PCC 7336]